MDNNIVHTDLVHSSPESIDSKVITAFKQMTLIGEEVNQDSGCTYKVDVVMYQKSITNHPTREVQWVIMAKDCRKILPLDYIEDISDNNDRIESTSNGYYRYYHLKTSKFEYFMGKSGQVYEVRDNKTGKALWYAYR